SRFSKIKNIKPFQFYLFPSSAKNILLQPFENGQIKNYFFFRLLSRVCVSISQSFSINARICLYKKKNMNSSSLTQVLINNEILIKVLKICWLFKLSRLVDNNIRLCRYLSSLFHIISIYIDIFLAFDYSNSYLNKYINNLYVYYILYSTSSILKNLSIMTYASIKPSINLRVSESLSKGVTAGKVSKNHVTDKKNNNKVISDIPINETSSLFKTNTGDENASSFVNKLNKIHEKKNISDNKTNTDNIKETNLSFLKGLKNLEFITNKLKKNEKKKNYKISNNISNTANNKENNSSKTYPQTKIVTIGEVSVTSELLSTAVDFLTVILSSHVTKLIKQKLCFYIFISSLHIFSSYKELYYLLK
ncbi:conserved protein, unknown function, partial [Hepatocystis sp. ex Piliocolobus tephrosceles]